MKTRVDRTKIVKAKKTPETGPPKGFKHPNHVAVKSQPPREKDPIKQAKDLDAQNRVLRLACAGMRPPEIAQQLGLDQYKVVRLLEDGLEEYREQNGKLAAEYAALAIARIDQLLRAHTLDALGSKDHKPNLKSATLYLNAVVKQHAIACGAKVRVEHTGAQGGPIRYFDTSKLTDEQLDKVLNAENPTDDVAAIAGGLLSSESGGGDRAPSEEGEPVH